MFRLQGASKNACFIIRPLAQRRADLRCSMRRKMHHFLFTYGTLMCEDIMNAVTGFCHKAFPARLQDFRRLAVKHASYPGIIRAEGYFVEGWVYSGISDAALSLLDRFEGDMYKRLRGARSCP